ncbi:MAG: hypothetical protein ABI651_09230 [Verrucomicrobiota bacterium]
MHVLYFIFAGLAGMCAFAFGLAAIMGFYDLERPRRGTSSSVWLLHIFSGGWFTVLRSVGRHWRTHGDLSRLVYYAMIALVLLAGLLYIGSSTT